MEAQFDGITYEAPFDHTRLASQLERVRLLMRDGRWRSLQQIARITGDPEASVSARLRDLRKDKFGGYSMDRERRGDPKRGLHVYRIRREPIQQPLFGDTTSGRTELTLAPR